LLFYENGLGNHRTDAARTQESGERSDDMDEKDDEIGHLTVLARTAYRQELCATSNSPYTAVSEVGKKQVVEGEEGGVSFLPYDLL